MAVPADHDERVYAGVLGKLVGVYLGRPFGGWEHGRILRELGPITGHVHERFDVPLVVTDDDVARTFICVRALEVSGSTVRGRVGGEIVLEADDADRPLRFGALALAVETGTVSAGRVSVVPLGKP